MMQNTDNQSLITPDQAHQSAEQIRALVNQLNQVILGQTELVELTVLCILSGGHLLLEGLPGLGKTELVKALSNSLSLDFRRVQFTPDLLPSDILGSPILQETDQGRQLVFQQGPVFSNLLLADEINRATPKTQSALLEAMQERHVTVFGETYALPAPFQSALLEAMQERHVTVFGETYALPAPFFVLATQNPIELEGTYTLPEAQLDRFRFKISVPSVGVDVLEQIVSGRVQGRPPEIKSVISAEELNQLFQMVERIHLPSAVSRYIARLVHATHANTSTAPEITRKYIRYGASPRAAIAAAMSSRAAALMEGRPNVSFQDVRRVMPYVLNHRIVLDYSAKLDGVDAMKVLEELLETIPELSEQMDQLEAVK